VKYDAMTRQIDARCMCDECEARTKETYTLTARCSHCGWSGTMLVRKGDRPSAMRECPHCEVAYVLNYGTDPVFAKEAT
jgi:rRNA maturation protein Nop10